MFKCASRSVQRTLPGEMHERCLLKPQFDLPRPILVIYWRWGLRKILPPPFLHFGDVLSVTLWTHRTGFSAGHLSLCSPYVSLRTDFLCVTRNFPVRTTISSLLSIHSLCFPLQCYHGSVVSGPFSQGVTIRSSTEKNIFKCEVPQTERILEMESS